LYEKLNKSLKSCSFNKTTTTVPSSKQNPTFARMVVPVHDTNTILIFFIEMQMAKVRKLKFQNEAVHSTQLGDFNLMLSWA